MDNFGHGHVYERPDGKRARCGGPGLCKECSVDQVRKDKAARPSGNSQEGWRWVPARLDSYTHCGHGKKYKGEDCAECDRIWNEECLERAYKNVARYSDKLGIPCPEIARTFKATPPVQPAHDKTSR